MQVDGLTSSRGEATSELLLLVGQRLQTQLSSELRKLHPVRSALGNCAEVLGQSARALQLVADDRDAWAYWRVGEELGLDWDFSDPEMTCNTASWPGSVYEAVSTHPQKMPSGALACVSKALAEQTGTNLELERTLLCLRYVWALIRHRDDDFHDCADLLDAAAAVVDYQLSWGIHMRVTTIGHDGPSLRSLASALREFAAAVAEQANAGE